MGRVLARRAARLTEAEDVVRPILEAVRKRGDKGLLEYARKFDGLERKSVRVPAARTRRRSGPPDAGISAPPSKWPPTNVRRYAEKQLPREWTATFGSGLKLGQIVRPLDTVGAYIPGWTLSPALHAHHDGGSGPSRGRHKHLRRLSEARD